jgi:hypothetical protein
LISLICISPSRGGTGPKTWSDARYILSILLKDQFPVLLITWSSSCVYIPIVAKIDRFSDLYQMIASRKNKEGEEPRRLLQSPAGPQGFRDLARWEPLRLECRCSPWDQLGAFAHQDCPGRYKSHQPRAFWADFPWVVNYLKAL